MADEKILLEMKNVNKQFPGVKALDHVSLAVRAGEVHALLGENGAGKSTLIKVLGGIYKADSGEIYVEGKKVEIHSVKDAQANGIAIIHQELTMIPELSITENIFMGNEIANRGLIDWGEEKRRTYEILQKVGLSINPDILIKHLGVGQQQLVEIAKALSKNVKLLILDEPTSALNEADSENLLNLMVELKNKGITCIMISHKLNEIAAVSDAVTVIRDGHTVESYDVEAGKVDEDKIIKAMVGRSIENRYPEHEPKIGDVIFEVSNWNVEDPDVEGRMLCKNASFNVRAGEIVGFAGLMGAGRTELMRSIFGRNYGIYRSGQIKIKGREVKLTSVEALDKITKNGLLDLNDEKRAAEEYRKSLKIKTANIEAGVTTLSGGNQQKVVLSKWMFTEPDILILDEPTRGIDVGAKYEIYKLIHQLADDGKAVILVSSELPELLGMADRIYTIFEGTITGELAASEANQEGLMKKMTITSN